MESASVAIKFRKFKYKIVNAVIKLSITVIGYGNNNIKTMVVKQQI